MTEIELKFQVPPERRAAVAAAVAGRARTAQAQRLQAAYHDTVGRDLAGAGVALRLRREGPRWVQTLKASGGDAMTRLEHNAPRPGRAAAAPPLDLSLHAGTPAGARLSEVLAGSADPRLTCQFGTDIRRLSRSLRSHGALVELAFDTGRVQAGAQSQSQPLCELEIELLRGSPAALLQCARQWVARHGLWLDTRSKAERGDLLARGLPYTPARKAVAVRLTEDMPLAAARRAVLQSCAQQVLPNASQVASGQFGDEHLHQLRVGLRRLRAALALFDGDASAGPSPLAAASAALFRELGAARDQAAIGAPLREQLTQAIAAAGLTLTAPSLPQGGDASPAAAVRNAASQALLLDLLDATLPVQDAADGTPLPTLLAARLDRWHRQVRRDARAFAELDDAARHRLRKRVKRLRYALEFTQTLYGAKKVARFLRVLAKVQDRLGALNDAAVAIAAFRAAPNTDSSIAFALGWLVARQTELAIQCVPALERFVVVDRPWKPALRPLRK